MRLVGGTFTFRGINSPTQYRLLRQLLRLSIYVHLCLLLEQTVLLDSGIQLKFARPKLPVPSPSTPTRLTSDESTTPKNGGAERKPRLHRNSVIPSSFTNFFLRRTFSYRRSQTINQPSSRSGGSLDLTTIPTSASTEAAPRRSIEGTVSGLRLRRISFLGDRRSPVRKSQSQPLQVETGQIKQPFSLALKRIEESRGLYSTTPGVILAIPKLVVELAEKEKSGAVKRRLKGDERVALASILGWDGKDAEGRGMSGTLGFIRHQEISVLRSTHVAAPDASPGKTRPSESGTASTFSEESNLSVSALALVTPTQVPPYATNLPYNSFLPCEKPRWTTYQYFSSHDSGDFLLGSWVKDMAMNRRAPCDKPGCTALQGEHEQRLIHGDVRVIVRVADVKGKERQSEGDEEGDDGDIAVWKSCAVCDAKTPPMKMGDATQ